MNSEEMLEQERAVLLAQPWANAGPAHEETASYWLGKFQRVGALWLHDDNPKRPHALLTSGKHSSGFFNAGVITEDPTLLVDAFLEPVKTLIEIDPNVTVTRVMGPAMGAITIAFTVARTCQSFGLNPHRDQTVKCGYFEKTGEGSEKRMTIPRTHIQPGEHILLVEDVITTAGSLKLAEQALTEKGAIVLPYVLALMNRSGSDTANGKRIISVITHPMPMWAPEACPLCLYGSEAIRPKGAEAWERLNATY